MTSLPHSMSNSADVVTALVRYELSAAHQRAKYLTKLLNARVGADGGGDGVLGDDGGVGSLFDANDISMIDNSLAFDESVTNATAATPTKKRKKREGKSFSAYMEFVKSNKTNGKNLEFKEIALAWKTLTPTDRTVYSDLADKNRAEWLGGLEGEMKEKMMKKEQDRLKKLEKEKAKAKATATANGSKNNTNSNDKSSDSSDSDSDSDSEDEEARRKRLKKEKKKAKKEKKKRKESIGN